MTPSLTHGVLAAAVVLDVLGTTFLQKSGQFTRRGPTLAIGGVLSRRVPRPLPRAQDHPGGPAYAIWTGLGVVPIALIGDLMSRLTLALAALMGLAFIVAGVVIVNVFSTSIAH